MLRGGRAICLLSIGKSTIVFGEWKADFGRHDIFIRLWEGRTNPGGIIANPLVAFGKDIDFEASKARNFRWDFIVDPVTVIEYIGQVLAWLRLCMIEEPGGFDGREYWASKVLTFDSLTEDWAAEDTVGFTGADLFNALATNRDADPASKDYQLAHKMTWRMLTRASMQKITHGKHLTKTPALGILWDMKENEGKDIEPGTFAELLRYGSVHFEQTREEIDYVKAKKSDIVLREKMLQD